MRRRIMVIDFPRLISEDEMGRGLEEKLTFELSGISNWALEGYKRLKERGFGFQEPQSVKVSKQSYREETDNIRAFVKTLLQKINDDDDRLKFGEVYQMYESWKNSSNTS